MKRKPVVSGQFYPSSSLKLSEQVKGYIESNVMKKRAIGVVSPHAGIMYSGQVAGAVYSRIEIPGTFILIGPNHTGLGRPVSIMLSGEWQLPTGELKIDENLARKIKGNANIIEEDSLAHTMEHSLLPFILHFSSDVKIVPITMMTDSLEICKMIGEAVSDAIKEADYPVTIIASSDMSHYVSDAVAREKDKKAIDKVIAIDPKGLYDTVRKERISMCGVIPVTAMLYAAKRLGAQETTLVKYMTSGNVSGDYDYVVGYAAMIVE
jgi:AmmeMemoRadiSam system protein B